LFCRIGPTGRNIFNRRDDHQDTHLHIGCWRFEPDMGDPTAPTLASTNAPPSIPSPPSGGEGRLRGLDARASAVPASAPRGPGGPKDNEILLVRRLFDETTERFTQLAKPFAKNYNGVAC